MQADNARQTPAARTAVFVGAGLALLAVGAWLQLRPALRYRETAAAGAVTKYLFPEFTDAAKAASLAIVSFDEDTATIRPFKVLKSGGVWALPSHQNYPADAREQLAAAATELIDRPVLDVVSTSPGDQETYGVIEPDADKVKVGATGVGQLIEIRDASGNRLARLVIGKEDRRPGGADAGGRTLRFVRRAGQDPIYRVELDTAKFTTRFDDWIEKDLLKLSPWDIRRLTVDDSTCSYDVDQATGLVVSQDRKARIDLAYDDKDAAWSLAKLVEFGKDDKPVEKELAADQELATVKLNDLRNALGDLKIVDVARKPAGLSAELKADEKFTGDREAVLSLAQRGFFPFRTGEILSSSGETVVGMKDGVEYLLRFGNRTTVEGDGDPAATEDGPAAGETGGRYLFVLARLNEALLEKPVLEPLPEVPAGSEDKPTPEADKPAGEAAGAGDAADKPAAGDDTAAAALAAADEAEAKAQAALEERRRIERENRLRQEEYDDKVKAAQKRVRELNTRFADWYYVVSDAEYAKIRLGLADVIRSKPPEEAPAAPADEPLP
jgi:hypothetical protein